MLSGRTCWNWSAPGPKQPARPPAGPVPGRRRRAVRRGCRRVQPGRLHAQQRPPRGGLEAAGAGHRAHPCAQGRRQHLGAHRRAGVRDGRADQRRGCGGSRGRNPGGAEARRRHRVDAAPDRAAARRGEVRRAAGAGTGVRRGLLGHDRGGGRARRRRRRARASASWRPRFPTRPASTVLTCDHRAEGETRSARVQTLRSRARQVQGRDARPLLPRDDRRSRAP